MKRIVYLVGIILPFIFATPAFAVSTPPEVSSYTQSTVTLITAIAVAAAMFFLVKGGYLYITSSGNPEALASAKRTIRNALIGLVIVIASGFIMSFLTNTLSSASTSTSTSSLNITLIETVQPPDGLSVILIDAISGLLQMLLVSAAKPVMNGVIGFLSSTPTVLDNAIILRFWLIMLGIADSLFVLVVALLGLNFMSSESLGFGEVELSSLLPRIGLSFLGANVSLFLANYVIITCNSLVTAVLNLTGGLSQTLLMDAVNPTSLITKSTSFITLLFMLLFLMVSIVLLFMYIGRLIFIALGAVLSPFIFLMWSLPKFSDFAEIAVKSYLVAVFTIFVHVVVIQLASAFISLPSPTDNSIVALAVGIGLFFSLLKIPQMLMQMVFYTSGFRSLGKIGGHIVNAITTDKSTSGQLSVEGSGGTVKKRRKDLGV